MEKHYLCAQKHEKATMKKALIWILAVLLTPVLLFLILTILLYVPPIQHWAVKKVAAIASEKTGMQISVGHVDLSFPIDLGIEGLQVLQVNEAQADTIAYVQRAVVDVQLLPLLSSKVIVNQLEVSNARFNTYSLVEAAQVKGSLRRFAASSRGIDLDRQTVSLNGTRLEDAAVDIVLRDSVPEDTTKSEPLPWQIDIDSIVVERTGIALHMPGDTMSVDMRFDNLRARHGDISLQTETYRVGSVDWTGGTLNYSKNFEPQVEGLDFNHIALDNIRVGIDSIYYHAPDLRLYMRTVQLREKSGLEVSNLTGLVAMENGCLKLPRFRLTTPDSDVDVELDMPLSLLEPIDPGKMRLRVNAQLGKQDLMMFMGDMPKQFVQSWPNQPLSIKGFVKGNMDHVEFSGLDVSLPSAFHATASGYAANLTDLDRLRAKVHFYATADNLGFVTSLLPRDVQKNYRIPRGITAQGLLKADGQRYAADVVARQGSGKVKARGTFDGRAMSYDVKASVDRLNLHNFMPHDSLYTVTADITANGRGTDFFSPSTRLQANARLHHLGYGQLDIDNVVAVADIRGGRAHADISSDNPLLRGLINFDALMSKQRLDATFSADLSSVDLYRLRVMDSPLEVSMCSHMDIESDLDEFYRVQGLINDLTIRDSAQAIRPGEITLNMLTSRDTTWAKANSGNLKIDFTASGGYKILLNQIDSLTAELMLQKEQKTINQPRLRQLLPTMSLTMSSDEDNPAAAYLKANKITFKDMGMWLVTSPATGVNGKGHIHSLTYDGTRLDTINFQLVQRSERLSFGGQVRNNKRNPQFVFNALFDGVLQEHGATVGVRYYDSDNRLGARVGAQAEVVDSGLNIHLVPSRPLLGYKEFALNDDNFVFLGADNKVKAKVNLIADDGTGVRIYSEETDPTALQDITVSLNRFNLDEITSVMPYVPRMTGLLNGDYHVVQDAQGQISMVSDMSVRGMTYERSPIGNVSTELVYLQKEDDAHAIEARLMKDDVEVGLLEGTYYNNDDGRINARLQLERLPLSMVNGFVPDQICGLAGYGEGELSVKGTLDKLLVDGEVYLDSSYLVSIPYGVALRFDDDPVRIIGSNLLFENFTVYAYNDQPLNIMGNVDFSNLERILVNLRMRAQNYQIIGAKEHAKSVAYGKAFVNFFGAMSGQLDNLVMRGKLDLLGTTDIGYILRDSPITTDNQLDELVRFTDFSDTTQTIVNRPALTGFKMDMTVDISKGAHIMAYMNADHSNYIDLMGGGTLRMTYNPADNLQLTGKYTLSNGEMKYSLPVIPLKTFTIQDGSYIEFTGEPMNPTLNISAVERTKATVTNTGGVGRSVEFDCGVVITKTLADMGLEFTLDAPEDMQLHSELMAMSTEQRGKLAVSMLTTGMYLADGNTGSFSMNSALSSFLNSEINQITGNALRTLDLSFGMDNTTDATGQTHTDYSFKFAKRFWNNRMKIVVGGKVTSGSESPGNNNSFFDNVSLEYRLDDTANKYVQLFYQNNAYDWLDGYTQKYGGGLTWRRTVQNFSDIFRLKDTQVAMPAPAPRIVENRGDSIKSNVNEKQ